MGRRYLPTMVNKVLHIQRLYNKKPPLPLETYIQRLLFSGSKDNNSCVIIWWESSYYGTTIRARSNIQQRCYPSIHQICFWIKPIKKLGYDNNLLSEDALILIHVIAQMVPFFWLCDGCRSAKTLMLHAVEHWDMHAFKLTTLPRDPAYHCCISFVANSIIST